MNVNSVVVGFDGSDCSQRALEAAMGVVKEGGAIHIVSAFDAPSVSEISAAYAAVPAEYTASVDLMREPRSKLEQATKAAADRGFAATDHFVDDDPASAILSTAEKVNADLIVVGSRGLGRASKVLRGSVSTKIAHNSHVNFMVIH